MATPRMDITSFVGKLLEEDDVDLLREGVRVLAQAVMETEVSGQIGAAPYERSGSRTAYASHAIAASSSFGSEPPSGCSAMSTPRSPESHPSPHDGTGTRARRVQ
jgi:hypothetical protein